MIEQLYRDTKSADRKRKPLTDELQQLANEQEKLEQQRNRLKDSITSATTLLAPLREQMKDVVECMKRFYEMENNYAVLSKQTYEDIHNDMQAIGSELLQTQSLLDDGTKLVNSGIELFKSEAFEKGEEREREKEKEEYSGRGISDSKGCEKEKEVESLDTPDVPATPVASIAVAAAPTEDMNSVWTDQTETLDPELSAMLNGLNNRDYENPESDKETAFEPFYDLLKEKLKDRSDVTIVADSEQNSALVEIFMSANEAKLLPDFSLMAEDEKLRIRGNYSNGQLSLDYDAVSENDVEPVGDFVADATKDSVKALLLSQIEKDLQENRQPVPESSERDL